MDPEKNKAAVYRWRKAHPEKMREYARKYKREQYRKDPERVTAYIKKWRENHPEKVLAMEIKRNEKIIDKYLEKIEQRKAKIEELKTQLTQWNHSTTTDSTAPSQR